MSQREALTPRVYVEKDVVTLYVPDAFPQRFRITRREAEIIRDQLNLKMPPSWVGTREVK